MIRHLRAVVGIAIFAMTGSAALAASSFICREPGGERLVEIDGNNVSLKGKPIALHIDDSGGFILDAANGDRRLFLIDGDNVQPGASPTESSVRITLATFDGDDLRHGRGGEVLINYKHPDLCPTASANRIYSIEGDSLSRKQLVAGLYLLKPEFFKLSPTETDKQLAAIKEAGAEQDKLDKADQAAGTYDLLNSSGIMEKVGSGGIVVGTKKGNAYPVSLDFSKGGGPKWDGVGFYEGAGYNDKVLYVAYGTPKTTAIGVYDIQGGKLSGKWYPWYGDGTAKSVGTENLSGPDGLNGEYKIDSAAAPATGAAYTGTVKIEPLEIVGTSDTAKPYSVTWTFGTTVIKGIGIKSNNKLIVASGTGADVCIAKWTLGNGTANSEWFKLGSTEMGNSAVMKN